MKKLKILAFAFASVGFVPGVNTEAANGFRKGLELNYVERSEAVELACRIEAVASIVSGDLDEAIMLLSLAQHQFNKRVTIEGVDPGSLN